MSGLPSTSEGEQLGQRAVDYACQLAAQFGARPAGGPAERQAQEWIAQQAVEAGYAVAWQAFEFTPPPAFLPYYSAAAAAFLLVGLALPVFPWAALALPPLIWALPDIAAAARGLIRRRARSANLLALPPGVKPEALRLLLCAHVDSARALPYSRGGVFGLRAQAASILQRSAWLMAVLGLIQALDLPFAPAARLAALILAAGLGLLLIPLDIYDQLGARQQFSPGANDNASGVGALLALLARLAPTAHPGVGFLFTGAEESGLDGARAFARQSCGRRRAGAPPLALISVDMVGSGAHLRIFKEVRSPRPVRTDPALNRLLKRADPSAVEYTAIGRSGDFVEFVRAGCQATGIEASGSPQFWRAYHTLHDRPDHLDPAAMTRACDMLLRAVDLIEQER